MSHIFKVTYAIINRKKRLAEQDSPNDNRTNKTVLSRNLRSAINEEDFQDTMLDKSGNAITEIDQNENITEFTELLFNYPQNRSHILTKRLDSSVNQDDGDRDMYENRDSDLFNPSPTMTNASVLDHMHILDLLQRQHREGKTNGHLPTVRIHNIISGLPKPEIEMLYAVYQGRHSNSSLLIPSTYY